MRVWSPLVLFSNVSGPPPSRILVEFHFSSPLKWSLAVWLSLVNMIWVEVTCHFFNVLFHLFLAVLSLLGLSPVEASGVCSASRWLLSLCSLGSRVHGLQDCGSRALEHRLNRCAAQVELLWGMRSPPRPGIKPVSPTSAGRFLSTVPPGKSPHVVSEKKLLWTSTWFAVLGAGHVPHGEALLGGVSC